GSPSFPYRRTSAASRFRARASSFRSSRSAPGSTRGSWCRTTPGAGSWRAKPRRVDSIRWREHALNSAGEPHDIGFRIQYHSCRNASDCPDRFTFRERAMDLTPLRLESLGARIGEEIGVSPWVAVDQRRIDLFAQAI